MSFANEKSNLAVSLRVRYDLPPFSRRKILSVSLVYHKETFFMSFLFLKTEPFDFGNVLKKWYYYVILAVFLAEMAAEIFVTAVVGSLMK